MFKRRNKLDAYLGEILSRFIVTLKDGSVASGVLTKVTARSFVFADVKLLEEGRTWQPAAGDGLFVDRAEVRYCQLMSSGGE
jgi:hypothetical protein